MKLKDYLLSESTLTRGYPDSGGIAGDDDHPTGNILMGRKYKKIKVDTPGGSYYMSVPVDNEKWLWSDFEAAKGMELKSNYHKSLLKNNLFGDKMWKHTKTKGKEGTSFEKEKKKKKKEEKKERKKYLRNIPRVILKINRTIGEFETFEE